MGGKPTHVPHAVPLSGKAAAIEQFKYFATTSGNDGEGGIRTIAGH
jgi:hypothetical protein